MSHSTGAPKPRVLPTVELAIEIRRELAQLEIARVELSVPGDAASRAPAQQLRWKVTSPLLPDELLIVFGKPLVWAGPHTRTPEAILHVEDAFTTPLALHSGQAEALSGRPRVDFPATNELVAWPFGVVLLRGRDIPLTADAYVRIRRID